MLSVHSAPVIEPDAQHGWQIIFWLGEAFDYGIPFRESLAAIAEALGGPSTATFDLPPFTADEDFVEGTLTFGPFTLDVYYEYSLGYLSLTTCNRDSLEDVVARVLPVVRVR